MKAIQRETYYQDDYKKNPAIVEEDLADGNIVDLIDRNGFVQMSLYRGQDLPCCEAKTQLAEFARLAKALCDRLETATNIIDGEGIAEDDIEDERAFLAECRAKLATIDGAAGVGPTQQRGIPRTDDDGQRRGNIHVGAAGGEASADEKGGGG